MECDEVVYEKRDGVAGVQFRKDWEEGWTPVVVFCFFFLL